MIIQFTKGSFFNIMYCLDFCILCGCLQRWGSEHIAPVACSITQTFSILSASVVSTLAPSKLSCHFIKWLQTVGRASGKSLYWLCVIQQSCAGCSLQRILGEPLQWVHGLICVSNILVLLLSLGIRKDGDQSKLTKTTLLTFTLLSNTCIVLSFDTLCRTEPSCVLQQMSKGLAHNS